jgi:hypothetical protein
MFGEHKEILQIHSMFSQPRGVVQMPNGKTDYALIGYHKMGKDLRVFGEKGVEKILLRGANLIEGLFVFGQTSDQSKNSGYISS